MHPNQPTLHQLYIHATQLLNQGQYQQSAALFQRVIKLDPKNCAAALQLARILLRANQAGPAKKILESVQPFAQTNFELLHMLGALQLQSGATEKALNTIEQALKLRSDFVPTINIKGNILLEQHRFEEAIRCFEQAIALEPTQVDPHNNLAWAYRAIGEKEKAIQHFNAAYQLDKRVTEALSGVMMLQRNEANSEAVLEAAMLLEGKDLSTPQRVDLNFSLGKAMEDCGDYAKAFSYFNAGNQLWHSANPYSIEEDKALFTAIKQACPTQLLEQERQNTHPDTPIPIFVVGMPRSSTSLVEQILASHSLVSGAGELPHISNLLMQGNMLNWQHSRIEEVRNSYLATLQKHAHGKRYVVDKMPQNFRFIGILMACFPEAKFVHCQRDPRDNCLSLFKHHFPMTSHNYAYDQSTLAQYHMLYQDLMMFWEEHSGGRLLKLSYETLVDDFDNQLARLLTHVGLEYEESCKNFHETKRAIRTASSDQVRRGLYKSGVDQWKHYETELTELFDALTQRD